MARTSRELTDDEGLAALAALAQRREASLRAALARMTVAARDANEAVIACERACDAQRRAWQDALSRGGVYGPREAAGAPGAVEVQRAALGEARNRHSAALAHAKLVDAEVLHQRERLQANARKQEKLRELMTFHRR
ncbi:hypothetical protein OYT13_04090 [Pandoraea sp. XJJ-1]|uniref:hypothetical protein n=1 Tax=unclassified Pandoraea TaxID=2624094 RepID=UPI0021C3FF09|nr:MULTISPECIES: hypothetical protein [unclassified Pandoraea]WAL83656.1 hypothetical protein OYT13_04090 [Pandoraea sp. XJJ-1]BDD91096.1 hypothetical protein PanNE5_05360 [Pandoraea sp. NE5]